MSFRVRVKDGLKPLQARSKVDSFITFKPDEWTVVPEGLMSPFIRDNPSLIVEPFEQVIPPPEEADIVKEVKTRKKRVKKK